TPSAASPEGAPNARLNLWREAGAYTASVWMHGVFHPDYLAAHLCRCTTPQGRSFALIDLDGVRFFAPGALIPFKHRAFNAMQILRSVHPDVGNDDERLAFLEAAFGE